jgi:hypothetical protein
MVLRIHPPDRAYAILRSLVSDLATQGVAGVGWIDNQPPAAHDARRLLDQPVLRVIGVNDEVLGHW